MQFEHITQYQHHRTPNKQELFTSLENAKLNTRIEGDEDHTSQLSTLQSLGNLESHATPEKALTPNSGKNLLASAEQKLGQAKDFVSRKSSIWTDEMSRKASGIKGKIVEKFGEEIQPEKDLDENVKEQIKEVNEEIKQIPHGEEEIVEGQGQAAPKNNVLGKKVKKAKNKVKAAVRELKPKSGRVMKKGFMKVYQVKEKVKQGAELVKENMPEMPKKEVEEAELTRKSSGSGVQDLKNISNDILSQALSKIEAMRIKAHNQTQLIQEQLHEMSAKSSSDKSTELKSAELKSPSGLGVDELVTMSRSLIDILDDALGKVEKMKIEDKKRRNEEESERRVEIYKITNQINEILEELKNTDQVPYEQMTERVESVQKENSEHHHLSTGSPSFEPVQESPSHHHLSAESQSFQPTQESHNLIKKVTTGLNRHVPLTKIVEKLDHQKNHKSQGPSRPRPAKETCYVLMQNIGGGMEELEPLVDKEEEIEEQDQLKPELSANLHEISRKGLDQIQHCIEEAFTRLAEQAESARRKLENVMNEEITLETRETESSQDKSPSSLEAVKESVQEIPEKISDKIEEIREDIFETKEEDRDDKQELKEEETHERRPLIDKIMDSIHSVNDNLHQRVEYVKQAFKVEEKTRESQPLLDVMSEKIHHITSKIPHKTESGEDNTELPQEEQEITEEVPELPQEQEESRELPKEKNPFLRQKVAEKLDQISHKISENIEHLKERLRTRKHDEEDAEGTEEFHEVKDGFHETVAEYKQETEIRPEELVTENMFQALEEREQEQEPEHKSLFQRIKGRFIKEKDVTEEEEEEEIHDVVEDTPDLRRDISEDVESFKARALEGKEKARVETFEGRTGDLPSEAVQEENHSFKQETEIRPEELVSENMFQNLEEREQEPEPEHKSLFQRIKGRFIKEKYVTEEEEEEEEEIHDVVEDTPDLRRDISEDVESFKARALKGKEEALVETMEGRADELPSEAVHEENHSLKERISEKIHDLSDRISQKVSNIKHVFTSEKEVPEKQEDEDIPVAETIALSADDLKKEQIVEPLLSSNPFEVLATKDANLVQPLESGEVVGGDLQELTGEEKPELKEDGLYEEIEDDDEDEENGQKKSLFSRILDAFTRKNKVTMV